MKRVIISIFILILSYCIYCICPDFTFTKHQIGDCGTLTVVNYYSIFDPYKSRSYFIPGEYKSFRLPKDCFYIYYHPGILNGYQVLCSCRDGKIVITNAFGVIKMNDQVIENYSSDRIILERVSGSKYDELLERGECVLLKK